MQIKSSQKKNCTSCSSSIPLQAVWCAECHATQGTVKLWLDPETGGFEAPRLAGENGLIDDLWLGTTVNNRYRIDRVLAYGELATTYSAHQFSLQRDVVLKVYHPQFDGERTLEIAVANEVKAASTLNHPFIATVFDISKTADGTQFVVQEHIRGRTLEDELQKNGPLPWQRAVRLAIQIGEALQLSHETGIAHGRITADKITIAPFDIPGGSFAKITDFSTCVPAETGGARAEDISAIGTLLFQMITGQLPDNQTSGDSANRRELSHLEGPRYEAVLRSTVTPNELESLILDLLDPDQVRLPSSMQQLVNALGDIVHRYAMEIVDRWGLDDPPLPMDANYLSPPSKDETESFLRA